MSIKISIIVPVHNTEQYLHRCLLSLINQTIKELEIICVNDASTDNSLSILTEFASKDNRIKIINLKENKKAGGARNAGLNCLTGEYIAFVDSDDWVDCTKYEKLYLKAKEKNSDVVTCQYYNYLSENEVVLVNNFPQFLESETNENINKYILLHGMRIWTNIYKRELLNHVRFPENCINEDDPVGPLLHLNKKISLVNEGLHFYRMDNLSLTRRKNNFDYFDRIETSLLFLSNIQNFYGMDFYLKYIVEIEYRFTKMYFTSTVLGAVSKFEHPQINYIKKVITGINSIFPNFYRNPYYRKLSSSLFKFIIKLIYKRPVVGANLYYVANKIRKLS